MKLLLTSFIVTLTALPLWAAENTKPVSICDGKTFRGWEGDTNKTWRIEEGAFVGGSLNKPIPHNDFLCTTRSYTNFILRAQFKLVGTGGFINGGVQVRSKHIKNPPYELSGYLCDMGDGWWGALYDESRRNKVLVKPEAAAVEKALKKNEWNQYEIRCQGKRIRTAINGVPMIDYTEPDEKIEQFGIIGLQIHQGGPAEASYKEITIQELP
jgi:3-keto-disaccharide hydrolase